MNTAIKLLTTALMILSFGFVMSGCDKSIKDAITQSSDTEIMDTTADSGDMVEENTPPLAYAGKDQKVEVGETVMLSAAYIPDADGDLLRYIWTLADKPAQSMATITDKMGPETSFVVDVFGSYTVRLMVDDGTNYAFDIVNVSTYLRASDFNISLSQQDTEVTVNWKDLSNTNDSDAMAVVVDQGTDGVCSITGDTLTYTEAVDDNTTDSCQLSIANDEESVQVTVTIRRGLYEFSGIKEYLPIADLNGWSECYKDYYATSGTLLDDIKSSCSGNKIMLACRETGSGTLKVAAYADRTEVFLNTGDGGNTVHTANGVDWYYSESYSMGFAPVGE